MLRSTIEGDAVIICKTISISDHGEVVYLDKKGSEMSQPYQTKGYAYYVEYYTLRMRIATLLHKLVTRIFGS